MDPETAAAILSIGRFKPLYVPDGSRIATTWEREIPEEHATVSASLIGGSLDLIIAPSISVFEHHLGKRITASVYFEIAARYAEKVGGEVIQRATVLGCKPREQSAALVVARYPSEPLLFDHVCPGFQAVLLGRSDADAA